MTKNDCTNIISLCVDGTLKNKKGYVDRNSKNIVNQLLYDCKFNTAYLREYSQLID